MVQSDEQKSGPYTIILMRIQGIKNILLLTQNWAQLKVMNPNLTVKINEEEKCSTTMIPNTVF
ncbi:MAG: hypothetical protein FWD52_01390 [Candidatus Bathyarchaeota archaeon]|nr:hypothetical protein [Candidatus Termiticorpusculum sp.]